MVLTLNSLLINHLVFSQAWYFDRDDVALPGFHKFCSENSKEEREHAEKFIKYQNRRGGRLVLQAIDVGSPIFNEMT